MARKKQKHAVHINHERWMVSFADFMTLMFALFVVLFAISQVDSKKLEQVADSMEQAFGVTPGSTSVLPHRPTPATNVIPPIVMQRQLAAMRDLKVRLEEALEKEKLRESVNIDVQERGLVVSLRDAAFFDSGEANLRSAVLKKLERFLRQMEGVPNDMRIEGHTDSVPINSAQFPSNWELSGARAGSLLRFMVGHTSIPARHLSIAGYADQRPIADNSREDGRQRNRRVDIVILTDSASRDEPLYRRFGKRPQQDTAPPAPAAAGETGVTEPGADGASVTGESVSEAGTQSPASGETERQNHGNEHL